MKLCDLMKLLMQEQKVQLNFYKKNCLERILKIETEFESDIYLKYCEKQRKNNRTSTISEHFVNDIDIANAMDLFLDEFYQLVVMSISADEVECTNKLVINIVI